MHPVFLAKCMFGCAVRQQDACHYLGTPFAVFHKVKEGGREEEQQMDSTAI